jgi:hypothetical protein
MILCADLEISVNDFWTSTPYEFNGLLRGAYQRQLREASLFLSTINSKKPIKLEKYAGFKLINEHKKEEELTTKDLMREMEEADRKAFKKDELNTIFDLFD